MHVPRNEDEFNFFSKYSFCEPSSVMPSLLSGNWDHIIKQPIESIFRHNHEPSLLDLCISILISNVSLSGGMVHLALEAIQRQ